MHILKHNRKTEAGNILVYILGAIFLLGILVITVKGSSTPGAGIDQESLIIRVAEVQEYGKELERAVAYILANGHSEVDIRFSHPDAASAYGDITDTPTRQIFSRQGGGATYRAPANGIQTTVTDWVFSGNNEVTEIGTSCGAKNCMDLVAILQNVNKEFCLLINNKNGITNPSEAPPQDQTNVQVSTVFTGTFTASALIADTPTGYLFGHSEGCFEGDTTPPAGTYHYYRVLLAR